MYALHKVYTNSLPFPFVIKSSVYFNVTFNFHIPTLLLGFIEQSMHCQRTSYFTAHLANNCTVIKNFNNLHTLSNTVYTAQKQAHIYETNKNVRCLSLTTVPSNTYLNCPPPSYRKTVSYKLVCCKMTRNIFFWLPEIFFRS